jgi:hypothetical protein
MNADRGKRSRPELRTNVEHGILPTTSVVVAWGRIFPLRKDIRAAAKTRAEGDTGKGLAFWEWREELKAYRRWSVSIAFVSWQRRIDVFRAHYAHHFFPSKH